MIVQQSLRVNEIPASGATLLVYALTTGPDLLHVGENVELALVLANPLDEPVTCKQIVLTLPVGTAATDLVAVGGGVEISPPPGWGVAKDGGVITLTAPDGPAIIKGQGVAFRLAVLVNNQPGTATVMIDETAAKPDQPVPISRTAEAALGKFPADFSLSDLTAVPPDRLDIAYRDVATLMWTATGEGVACTLAYQPTDEESWISDPALNSGPKTSVPLTRSGGVVFTLTARIPVLGQDQPLVDQRQLQLSIATTSLTFEIQPPAVAPSGLVRLRWHAPNATHCMLEDGAVLPPSGAQLLVLQQSRRFVLTAYGPGEVPPQVEHFVEVRPSIQANQPPITVTGKVGVKGTPGALSSSDDPSGPPTAGGPGGPGGPAVLNRLPPLDETDNPVRVIPITLTGGGGGPGGPGGATTDFGGNIVVGPLPDGHGGQGGDAVLDLTFDISGEPAQFIVTLVPGLGGHGGRDGDPGNVLLTLHDG